MKKGLGDYKKKEKKHFTVPIKFISLDIYRTYILDLDEKHFERQEQLRS